MIVVSGAPHGEPVIEPFGLSMWISLSMVQYLKAELPMEVTEFGMVMLVRLEQ